MQTDNNQDEGLPEEQVPQQLPENPDPLEHEPLHETEDADFSPPALEGDNEQPVEEDDEDDDEGKPYMPDDYNSRRQTTETPFVANIEYDDTTKALIETAKKAKEEFSEVEGRFLDLSNKLRELEVSLETDYGEDDVFLALQGQCFEMTDREYTYKMCPFDRASQRGKDGGSETNLGRWGKWNGPAGSKYDKMKFEGGATCWQGPPRSVDVTLRCGLQNQLISAAEPSRCEYTFDFETPALCVVRNFGTTSDHDEL